MHFPNGLSPSEFKTSLEVLSSFGFVEIMKTKNSSTSILDLIQTYLGFSGYENSKKGAFFYLEFLEAGIIEVYSAHQNILEGKYEENEVFDRD